MDNKLICEKCGEEFPATTERARTCFDCIHCSVCELSRTIDNFPPNWLNNDGPKAPLKKVDLYTTLAGCCLLFQGREKG